MLLTSNKGFNMASISSPINIGKFTLNNRITMAPTVKFDYTDDSGLVTEKHIEHYTLRAKGGQGLICVEATAVLPTGRFGKNHMGLWDDEQIEGHKKITAACHKYGAIAIIQLNHTGYVSNPQCGKPIGPSKLDYDGYNGKYETIELSVPAIHQMQNAYVSAAIRAQKAGYDGIQLHGCHGYLINQFVSAENNKRTDEYGGSPENRARFAAEIISDIRNICGPDFLISVRTTGCDPTIEDAIKVAEEYVKAGCNYLQISTGMTSIDNLETSGPLLERTPTLGIKFHQHFKGKVPVSCVGGIKTVEEVKYLLENDLVDTVDLGRAVLADPEFTNKATKGLVIDKCYGCKACQFGPFTEHKCPYGKI